MTRMRHRSDRHDSRIAVEKLRHLQWTTLAAAPAGFRRLSGGSPSAVCRDGSGFRRRRSRPPIRQNLSSARSNIWHATKWERSSTTAGESKPRRARASLSPCSHPARYPRGCSDFQVHSPRCPSASVDAVCRALPIAMPRRTSAPRALPPRTCSCDPSRSAMVRSDGGSSAQTSRARSPRPLSALRQMLRRRRRPAASDTYAQTSSGCGNSRAVSSSGSIS
jgi:hypothetical protein